MISLEDSCCQCCFRICCRLEPWGSHGEGLASRVSCAHQVVKAPGNLVISAYVTCPDITLTVTPDLKLPGAGRLLWVDLAGGQRRLGGSALAQAYSQARAQRPKPTAKGFFLGLAGWLLGAS